MEEHSSDRPGEKERKSDILQSNSKMRWKRRMFSGVFLEASSVDIMSNNDKHEMCLKRALFPISLKYVDVFRRTNSTFDVLQKQSC